MVEEEDPWRTNILASLREKNRAAGGEQFAGFEEAVESVQSCIDGGSSALALPIMCELSAAMIELPQLTSLALGARNCSGDGPDGTKELIACQRGPLVYVWDLPHPQLVGPHSSGAMMTRGRCVRAMERV